MTALSALVAALALSAWFYTLRHTWRVMSVRRLPCQALTTHGLRRRDVRKRRKHRDGRPVVARGWRGWNW